MNPQKQVPYSSMVYRCLGCIQQSDKYAHCLVDKKSSPYLGEAGTALSPEVYLKGDRSKEWILEWMS